MGQGGLHARRTIGTTRSPGRKASELLCSDLSQCLMPEHEKVGALRSIAEPKACQFPIRAADARLEHTEQDVSLRSRPAEGYLAPAGRDGCSRR